jgi:hypothetical protein
MLGHEAIVRSEDVQTTFKTSEADKSSEQEAGKLTWKQGEKGCWGINRGANWTLDKRNSKPLSESAVKQSKTYLDLSKQTRA